MIDEAMLISGMVTFTLLLFFGIPFIIFFIRSKSKLMNLFEKIDSEYGDKLRTTKWHKFIYSNPSHHRKWFKLLPWQGGGIMIFDRERIIFDMRRLNGEGFRKEINKNTIKPERLKEDIRNPYMLWLKCRFSDNTILNISAHIIPNALTKKETAKMTQEICKDIEFWLGRSDK